MNTVPAKFHDLMTTPEKRKLLEIISAADAPFTVNDLCSRMPQEGVNVSIATVRNVLLALCYRGYLTQFNYKADKRRGRSMVFFQPAYPIL